MRCLTLAKALTDNGADCSFICRDHIGNLIDTIQKLGFLVYKLGHNKDEKASLAEIKNQLYHANWLGVTQKQDATDCLSIFKEIQPEWVVVDHYALDKEWQCILEPYYKKLMVIDDLGDREHIADLLLDQNYGSTVSKYQSLVSEKCSVLTGTQYTLLRPEFAECREYSLKRRSNKFVINSILVTLGGTDPDNYTSRVLQQLINTEFNPEAEVIVVMGAKAPNFEAVNCLASEMSVKTTVMRNVDNMAELMSNADLAIGAAGATTWERCCLGLPTIQIVIAENQRKVAMELASINVVKLISEFNCIPQLLENSGSWMKEASKKSATLVDGYGTDRVFNELNNHLINFY
ncbi:UDP-2,4-diacetamido-2,4,6-trideoxy-beta-L-altropyranose hydrolase [Psychrobacter immobilis]|uniref:UDP-2,4-diacetamido-2,4, 6-trideoxy-beta-L-altropyranose hydrolase n=1 Tax=Psychrobacter immobilis TaxID=498 RepID=UPI00223408C0|nr:UDP-2,4-diacetamido-2,4,6-trideoxy-beta-L-altropyranose hydrolase [Psychrobacter immobilis]